MLLDIKVNICFLKGGRKQMDISKDGTRLEEFTDLLLNNSSALMDKITMNIKNPSIFKDYYLKSLNMKGVITYAYAANLITKSEADYLKSISSTLIPNDPGVPGPTAGTTPTPGGSGGFTPEVH